MDLVQNVSEIDVRNMVLEAYGVSQVYARVELDEMMAKDGDIRMDSAPAAVVIAKIEKQLGRKLPEPSDLRPEEFNSVNNLVALIMQKIRQGEGKLLKRSRVVAPAKTGI